MIEYLYDDFYSFTEKMYEKYDINNDEMMEQIIFLEEDTYNKLNSEYLVRLYDYVLYKLKEDNQHEDDCYEVILYKNKESLIIRRIFYKLLKKIYEYPLYENSNITQKYIIEQDKNIFYISSDIENGLYELQEKIISNIETKFLYFLLEDRNLKINKQNYVNNMSFISPYLEEKLLKQKDFNLLIKDEDNLYNNLWEYIKEDYSDYLYKYILEAIDKDIVIMHSKRDINNDDNTKVREIYLRTLFNYLDSDTIEAINYKFRSIDLYPYNKKGYESVVNAFKLIEKDKREIEKIKTH